MRRIIFILSLSIYLCLHKTIAASSDIETSTTTGKKLLEAKISFIRPDTVRKTDSHHLDSRQLLQSRDLDKSYAREITAEKRKLSNPEVFGKLGLGKMKMSPNHHRKRLAVESRQHGHPDDSNMYIIKLPPNINYYGNQKPLIDSLNAVTDDSKKVSLGFQSNGKPGRIYHWNLPVLKKLLHGNNRPRNPNSRHTDDESELIDIKNIPTWSNPWDNDTIEKQYREGSSQHEKILKKKSPQYFAPVKAKNFQKYFPSNGKPKSFYVIKSHKLIPFNLFKKK